MILQNQQAESVLCYVALGSNLGDSVDYLKDALKAFKKHPNINFLDISLFYKSKPHGPQNQPDYLNAVVKIKTSLQAEALLNELQEIENQNNRLREGVERWGARTLDLDLLFYGDKVINTKRLTVPHPRICERAFVLYPLRDLIEGQNPCLDLKITDKTTLNDCIEDLSLKAKSEIKEFKINV